MSKIGKKLITIPEGVQVSMANDIITVKGPKGEQSIVLEPRVQVEIQEGQLKVAVKNPHDRRQAALWGTFRALLENAVRGVTEGFEVKLEVIGVGYKAGVEGQELVLHLGYSHPITLPIPEGLTVRVEKNVISVSGAGKQAVGQFAALIRSHRRPEPYKGKGIKYQDEVIRRKPGKVVKAVGAG